MNDELKLVERSMADVPPIRPEVLARLDQDISRRIATASKRGARRRRSGFVVAAAAASMVAIVAGAAVLLSRTVSDSPSDPINQPPPLVTFTDAEDGSVIVRINDPNATKKELADAMHERGYDISPYFVPGSPSIVGTIVYIGDDANGKPIQGLGPGDCDDAEPCKFGFKIPPGYSGHSDLAFARAARPGEEYASFGDSPFAPGEPLHCVQVLGQRVSDVTALLQNLGFTFEWRQEFDRQVDETGVQTWRTEKVADPPDEYFVTDATASSATHVALWVGPDPPASTDQDDC